MLFLTIISLLIVMNVKCDMIFEIQLIEYKNPSNASYSNKRCLNDCQTGFLFCLIDLPFRNPQNCTLGDHVTPVLGGNKISFSEQRNYTYKFHLKNIPPKGMGMMIEVRNYVKNDTWDPLDFYTSALADVPLSKKRGSMVRTVRKRFSSLFNHTSSLLISSKLYCDKNYFGKNCDIYCDENSRDYYSCNEETGAKECNEGFIGEYCDIPDICATMPCLNGGKCKSEDGMDYSCKCTSKFTGENCEKVINRYNPIISNPCYSQPCFNSGTCRALNNNQFDCDCKPGYHGNYCEADLRRCTSNPCSKGCKCVEVPRNYSYECVCGKRYKNNNSQERFNYEIETKTTKRANSKPHNSKAFNFDSNVVTESIIDVLPETDYKLFPAQIATKSCEEYNPCRHGTCHIDNVTRELTCECFQGYMGPYCDLMRHPCDFKPCENGGHCEIVGDLYYKCLCRPNFTGINCQIEIQPCNEFQCINGGTCKVNEQGDPYCLCSSNYTGKYCENVKNACYSNPCKNNGKCEVVYRNTQQEIKCICKNGYSGEFCEVEKNPCKPSPCKNDAKCETINDQSTGRLIAKCTCKNDIFSGEFCENIRNPCDSSPCKNNGICLFDNATLTFKCDCPKFFYGKFCENSKRNCNDLKCLNDGLCVENLNETIECKCTDGFSGEFCENYEGCNLGGSLECKNDGQCDASGFCDCPKGFYGQTCEFDVDECLAADSCNKRGICKNLFGSFECTCDDGFYGDRCELINGFVNELCEAFQCENNSTCSINDKNETFCNCKPNFTGTYCESRIDICKINNPCLNNGTCVSNSDGTYACDCLDGFNGFNCELLKQFHVCDIENPCLNNGSCLKNEEKYVCNCTIDFSGDNCEIKKEETNECDSNPCMNTATCHTKPSGGYYCECSLGFHGVLCEEDINICEFGVCQNAGTCIDGYGANYSCICAPGFTGAACQIEINECESNPCVNGGTCVEDSSPNSYKCKCLEQFTGLNCESTINCTNYCLNNGTCSFSSNKPTCSCTSEYTGVRCDNRIQAKLFCMTKKCQNGGECEENENNAKCICKQGFKGENCEIAIKCDDSKITCFNNATCVLDDNHNEICVCTPNFTGEKCDILIKNINNQSNGLPVDASFVKASTSNKTSGHDNGVWLIVIVFGYIFGLFIIFVVIWFVWYGTSIRKRQEANTSNFNLAGYDYSTNKTNHSLKKPSSYMLDTIQCNPNGSAINERSVDQDLSSDNLNSTTKFLSLSHSKINQQSSLTGTASVIVDENASLHSSSFIHSYQNRI